MAENDKNEALFSINASDILVKLHIAAAESYKGIGVFYNSGIKNPPKNPDVKNIPKDCKFDMSSKSGQYEVAFKQNKPIIINWKKKEEIDKIIDKELEKIGTIGEKNVDEKKNKRREELYQQYYGEDGEFEKVKNETLDKVKTYAAEALMQYLKVFVGQDKVDKIKASDLLPVKINVKEPIDDNFKIKDIPDDEKNSKEMNERGRVKIENLCFKVGYILEKETM